MHNLIVISIVIAALELGACSKPVDANGATDKSMPGPSGDEGIQREKKEPIDKGIQGEPINPPGNPAIIIPPPEVNMPADIVPEKPDS